MEAQIINWLKPTENPKKDYYWFLRESKFEKCFYAELVVYPPTLGKLGYTENYFKNISYYTKADLSKKWIVWDENNFPIKGFYWTKDRKGENEEISWFSAPYYGNEVHYGKFFSKINPPEFFLDSNGLKIKIISL